MWRLPRTQLQVYRRSLTIEFINDGIDLGIGNRVEYKIKPLYVADVCRFLISGSSFSATFCIIAHLCYSAISNMLRSNLVTCILLLQLTAAVAVPPRKSLVSRQYDSSNPYSGWPSYADLPLDPSYPTKAAWGVWVHSLLKYLEAES